MSDGRGSIKRMISKQNVLGKIIVYAKRECRRLRLPTSSYEHQNNIVVHFIDFIVFPISTYLQVSFRPSIRFRNTIYP